MSRQDEMEKIKKVFTISDLRPMLMKFDTEEITMSRLKEIIIEHLIDNGIRSKDGFTWKHPKIDTNVGYYEGKNCVTIEPINYKEDK